MTGLLPAVVLPALVLLATSSPPVTAGGDDPVFRAMTDEVKRAQTLKMNTQDPPYWVSADVNATERFDVSASFGAITHRGSDTTRTASVEVRVGSATLDNTNFQGRPADRSRPVPREDDYDALRQMLWLYFDTSYKGALEALARKKAYLETSNAPDRPDDFGPAEMTSVVLPRAQVQTDQERWTRLVKQASGVFRDKVYLLTGGAFFHSRAGTQWMVTTDPVQDRFSDTMEQVTLSAMVQAPDGQEIEGHWEARGRTESDMPDDKTILAAAHDLCTRLDLISKAPLLDEDYTGPILFTGSAAAQFFLSGIGDTLSRPRAPLGVPPSGRLIDRLGRRIAAHVLTVRDDPTLQRWNGKPLLGWYPVDDDGVKPQPITLVEKGMLRSYYMSRIPSMKLKTSNGHARAGEGQPANLFVETSEPLDREAMKARLIALVKDQGLDYGLMVEELHAPAPNADTSRQVSADINLPAPQGAIRVFPDGREELVRVAAFKPVSFRALDDIDAMGNDPQVFNTEDQGQQVSVVAPSVLVKLLDLKKPGRDFEKKPIISRPEIAASHN